MASLLLSLHKPIAIACLLALLLGAAPAASADPHVGLIPFRATPTSVGLVFFRATPTDNGYIRIDWETATELDLVAFRLSRSVAPTGEFTVIDTLPSQGNAVTGAAYTVLDADVAPHTNYYYLLEAVRNDATVERTGLTAAGAFVQYLPFISSRAWEGVDADGNFYRGNPNATVKLEEFVDFGCPYCVRHGLETAPQIRKTYVETGEVVEVFHNFAFVSSNSISAAKAAYCAGWQAPEYFWSMADWLFQNWTTWRQATQAEPQFRDAAIEMGAGASEYDACVANPATAALIQREFQDGLARGVWGVPTFFINRCTVLGDAPFETFEQTIEQAKLGLCDTTRERATLPPGVQLFDADLAPGLTCDGNISN
ncbi:MAG: thioredoxin domain-containing protein [Nitrososphaerales archaeon]